MAHSIKYNDGKLLSIDMIRRLDRMTAEEQAQMSESLGIDGSKFQTRICLSTGKEKKARDDIEVIASQVPLVDVGADRFVIAQNIIGADPFTEEDAAKARARGSKFNHEFKSAVDTVAGRVLSTVSADVIMQRKAATCRPSVA